MDEKSRKLRRQVAGCIRQLLSGNVSCDHLIEEFRHSEDEEIRGIISLIEKETESIDRYERMEVKEPAFRESMERLIKKLEEEQEPADP